MNALRTFVNRAGQISWVLFLVALPVTSFPFFPGGLGGRTLVRPLSLYPLIIVVLLLTLPRLFRRPLSKTAIPLIAFCLVALLASMLSLSSGPEFYKGISNTSRIVRNLVTLGIGCAIYFSALVVHENWTDMQRSLRWLYIGFGIAFLWGTLQIVYLLHFSKGYFDFLNQIQAFISTRRLFNTRISGMTYEPKWFAEQISFLLLPWLMASLLSGQSVFKFRRFKFITVELLMLTWAFVLVIFTYSRTGFLLLILTTFLSVAYARLRQSRRIPVEKNKFARSRWAILVQAGVVVSILVAVFVGLGANNLYFARIWRYFTAPTDRPANKSYLEHLGINQRVVYWLTAFYIFEDHPWMGVGLGNYAFYFADELPDQPWFKSPEIIRQITPLPEQDRLITPKNLYARLLAETGLVGTATFTTFLIAIAGDGLYLWFSRRPEEKFWGIAGMLGLVTFGVVLFSFDSFALPNMWVVFGLITAAAGIARRERARRMAQTVQQPIPAELASGIGAPR